MCQTVFRPFEPRSAPIVRLVRIALARVLPCSRAKRDQEEAEWSVPNLIGHVFFSKVLISDERVSEVEVVALLDVAGD